MMGPGSYLKKDSTRPILGNYGVHKRVQHQDPKKRDSKESTWYKQQSF